MKSASLDGFIILNVKGSNSNKLELWMTNVSLNKLDVLYGYVTLSGNTGTVQDTSFRFTNVSPGVICYTAFHINPYEASLHH
ncbi:MAG: hypothetical protein LBU32_26525 [Clostridiales bacterium]|nr:hypothetical protein [Clostridiales bacterium]